MNLKELQAMSTKELLELHNKHAEKAIKRASTREALIKRTAKLIGAAGSEEEPAKKVAQPKKEKSGGRGRPPKDFSTVHYAPAAKFPVGKRLSQASARTKVYNYITDNSGVSHTDLEKKFPQLSMLGVIKYLHRNGFIEVVK